MSRGVRGPVVIDTGVFSARLGRGEGHLATESRSVLEGRPAVISFVTVAELHYGAKVAGWGSQRFQRLNHELARAKIVWSGMELAEHYAALRAWCVRNGHGLGQKDHEADRWVGGCHRDAPWVPLAAHDAIFANVTGWS